MLRLENRADICEKVRAPAERLVCKVERSRKQSWPIEYLMKIARSDCAADLRAFEMILDTAEDDRRALFALMTAGQDRLLRMLIA